MSSLYVDRKGVELRLDGEALAFYEKGVRVGTVPLAPLERVYLRGDIQLRANLLGKLGERGIGVLVQSGRRGDVSLLLAQPHQDAARRVAQYHCSQAVAFCLGFARDLMMAKLAEQRQVLLELREMDLQARYELTVRVRQLDQYQAALSAQASIAALRGLEGAAAASYFAGLAAHLPGSLHFSGRNRRPPRDPFNAVLSLGYTLLHAECVQALFGAGLDPFIGFYHGLDYGRESLACDVMEPLRPRFDRWAVQQFHSGGLRPEDFSHGEQGCLMGKAARARFYPAYEMAAEQFRKPMAERIATLLAQLREQAAVSSPQARMAAPAAE